MSEHITHSWQEVVAALKPLEGKILREGAWLQFKVLTVDDSEISVAKIFSNGASHVLNITNAWRHIHERIEKSGKYSLNTYQAYHNKLHRYFVYIMAEKSRDFFRISHNNINGTDVIYYAKATSIPITMPVIEDDESRDEAKRVIAIVGAGAAMELGENESPSTSNLTKHVMEIEDEGASNILKQIKRTIATKYKDNFEAYFHVVEQFVAFYYDWEKSEDKEYGAKHPLSRFIKPDKIFNPKQKKKQPKEVLRLMLIQLMDQIDVYNQYFEKEKNNKLSWYRDFWKLMADAKWDIFTFNYDTTIESSLEGKYTDGYWGVSVDYKHFEPQKYIKERNSKHTINHIHGCLLYSGEQPNYKLKSEVQEVYSHNQYKWKDYEANRKQIKKRDINVGRSQSGDIIMQDSIITGLHKTDKIVSQPYAFYRTQLDTQLLNNNRLLIVGYSFNDYYVNNMLESISLYHMDYKIVIIDCLKIENIKEWEGNAVANYFQEHPEKTFMLHFIEAIMLPKDSSANVWDAFRYDKCEDNYIYSKDEHLMIFMGGFKEATNHKELIYDYLTAGI